MARSAMDRLARERPSTPGVAGQPEGLGMGGCGFGKMNPKTPYNVNDLQIGWRPVGDA
ncbi:protein of unknown function [Hyphomicrobium sp. 1Nfss2.1]